MTNIKPLKDGEKLVWCGTTWVREIKKAESVVKAPKRLLEYAQAPPEKKEVLAKGGKFLGWLRRQGAGQDKTCKPEWGPPFKIYGKDPAAIVFGLFPGVVARGDSAVSAHSHTAGTRPADGRDPLTHLADGAKKKR